MAIKGGLFERKTCAKSLFLYKYGFMKGVTFVTDDKNKKIAVQIDLKTLGKHQDEIEDILDVIVAENRKDDEDISWNTAKKELKKAGKL